MADLLPWDAVMLHKMARQSRQSLGFTLTFFFGFLMKYNMLQVRVFQAPSLLFLLMRNLIFLLVLLVYFLPIMQHRRGRRILLIWYVLFTLFFFVNVWYNRYFGNYLSISDVLMGRGMRPVRVLLLQLLRPVDGLMLLITVLLFVSARYSGDAGEIRPYGLILGRYRKTWAAVIIALCVLQVTAANGRFGDISPVMLYRRSTPAFASVYGITPLYAMEYTMMFHPETISLPAPQQDVSPSLDQDLTGKEVVCRRKNIISIQVESLDTAVIGLKHNGREVTPFLNSLLDQSLYFDNFYAQHTNGSFDAELSFLTSVYPINKNFGFKVNDMSSFESLPRILSGEGYETLAFHGNDKTFFYRDKAYEELGFDRFYSREDFDESRLRFSLERDTFGINDYDFFLQSAHILAEAPQPFFALLITVTSHTPFDFYPEQLAVEAFEDIQNPLVREYFQSMAFVDYCLEMFFFQLEDAGLLEDSLIVIYSDHDAAIDRPEYSSKREFVLKRQVKKPEHIPLFIMHPKIEPGVSHKEGTPVDLAPTILDLLGSPEKPEEFLGYSLLGNAQYPLFFLHELPQVFSRGQLYGILPEQMIRLGHVAEVGYKEMEFDSQYASMMLEYLRDVVFERRSEDGP